MPTLAYLKAKIADDLHRDDLTTQISDAITNSVRRYNRERLWFLEGTATLTTSASAASYPLPSDFKAMDSVLLNISGSTFPLTRNHYSSIDDNDYAHTTGKPSEYTIYGDSIRFYPTPDSAYSTTISYLKALDTPSDSGSNVWTSAAFDVIRYAAEKEIYRSHLRNPEMGMVSAEQEGEAISSLLRENVQRISIGQIKRSGF